MKSSDKPKIIAAVVILVIALALIAYQFDLFGGGASTVPPLKSSETPPAAGPRLAPTGK